MWIIIQIRAGLHLFNTIINSLGVDVFAYIPTHVISITGGQIFLETDLAGLRLAPLDATTQSLINKGRILIELLKQKQNLPMCMPLQLSTLFELIFTESRFWNLSSNLSFMNIIYMFLCYKVKLISKTKITCKIKIQF